MEVKIKQDNEMLDATIEMVDGVMVVSPKEVKFEPKDGDVVKSNDAIWIFYSLRNCGTFNAHAVLLDDSLFFTKPVYCEEIRPATEEEKKKLFDKLAEEGYEFDFEKKGLVKLKWKPKEGEEFWFPLYYYHPSEFKPIKSTLDKERDKVILDKGWYFKTKEECQVFCNRLNQAIEGVKP